MASRTKPQGGERSSDRTADHCDAIIDYGKLLAVLVAQPDAETVLSEMNRVLHLIVNHAAAIKACHTAMALGKNKNTGPHNMADRSQKGANHSEAGKSKQ